MAAEDELYPFTTPDGKLIPLDIILPLSAVMVEFAASVATAFTIPESCELCSLYSSTGCFLRMGAVLPDPLVSGTEYSDTLFIPPYTTITSKLIPGSGSIYPFIAADSGILVLQGIQKWAFAALPRQLGRI